MDRIELIFKGMHAIGIVCDSVLERVNEERVRLS